MKKVIYLLCVLILTTGCYYEKDSLIEEEVIQNESLNKLLNRTTDQNNPITQQELIDLDLYNKFKIITYISGAVLLRNESARSEIENALDNNNTILVADLLSRNFPSFKCEYEFIFYTLIGMGKPLDPSGELEFDGIFGDKNSPKKDSNRFNNVIVGRCSLIDNYDVFDIFISDFHDNCFELYFPTPFPAELVDEERFTYNDIENIIYGIPHPLIENPFSQGNLVPGQRISKLNNSPIVNMSYINIEDNFLETHTQNVFVTRLRPMLRDCDYGEFSSSFFGSFLNN